MLQLFIFMIIFHNCVTGLYPQKYYRKSWTKLFSRAFLKMNGCGLQQKHSDAIWQEPIISMFTIFAFFFYCQDACASRNYNTLTSNLYFPWTSFHKQLIFLEAYFTTNHLVSLVSWLVVLDKLPCLTNWLWHQTVFNVLQYFKREVSFMHLYGNSYFSNLWSPD